MDEASCKIEGIINKMIWIKVTQYTSKSQLNEGLHEILKIQFANFFLYQCRYFILVTNIFANFIQTRLYFINYSGFGYQTIAD